MQKNENLKGLCMALSQKSKRTSMSLSHVGRVVLRNETLPGKQGYVFQWRRQFFNHCCFPGLEGSGVVNHCHASNDLCGTDQMMYTQDRKKKVEQKEQREGDTHTHTHTTHIWVRLWKEAPMSWW